MLSTMILLDRNADNGLVRQVFDQIRQMIEAGKLETGKQLPPSRHLAKELGVGRNTVMLAYEQLVLEGYLTSDGRRGTRVSDASRAFSRAFSEPLGEDLLIEPTLSQQAQRMMEIGRRDRVTPSTFQPGLPDVRDFPHELWGRLLRRAARQLHSQRDHAGYAYFDGLPELRNAVLDHISATRGVVAESDQVIFLSSAQVCMDLVCRLLLDPEDHALHEEPGYAGMLAALRGVGATMHPVFVDRMDAYGALDAMTSAEMSPRLIYATPSHQFPTGKVMSLEDRLALLRYAQKHEAFVLEDDYDSEFHFSGAPISCLQGLDRRGIVIYMGTFAKSLMPAMRVAYLVLPKRLVAPARRMLRNIGAVPGYVVQQALADFLREGHFKAHLRDMNRAYQLRRDVLVDALQKQCSEYLAPIVPEGGIQLPANLTDRAKREGWTDSLLVSQLREEGVESSSMSSLYWSGLQTIREGVFLGYAASHEAEIEKGVATIARLLTTKKA